MQISAYLFCPTLLAAPDECMIIMNTNLNNSQIYFRWTSESQGHYHLDVHVLHWDAMNYWNHLHRSMNQSEYLQNSEVVVWVLSVMYNKFTTYHQDLDCHHQSDCPRRV